MKPRKFIALKTLLLILCTATVTYGQLLSEKIDSLAKDGLNKFNVAGVAIAIVKDGKVIHQKGYGVTSIATNQPVNEQTNFQIASNTKAFTTSALSILVDEGKLRWTDKVKDYIPEIQNV